MSATPWNSCCVSMDASIFGMQSRTATRKLVSAAYGAVIPFWRVQKSPLCAYPAVLMSIDSLIFGAQTLRGGVLWRGLYVVVLITVLCPLFNQHTEHVYRYTMGSSGGVSRGNCSRAQGVMPRGQGSVGGASAATLGAGGRGRWFPRGAPRLPGVQGPGRAPGFIFGITPICCNFP